MKGILKYEEHVNPLIDFEACLIEAYHEDNTEVVQQIQQQVPNGEEDN